MCGVIGVYLTNISEEDVNLVDRIFRESMIRGKHATGVSYLSGGELKTVKEPIPVNEFLERHPISSFVDDDCLKLIGHIRYSTSDIRYNQPFQGKAIAIAHNGVISQDENKWEYETETRNDSELILRCIEAGDQPLEVYKDRSMAVVALEDDCLYAYRNHERPLWLAHQDNGLIAASTRDILVRSDVDMKLTPTEPLVLYSYNDFGGFYEDRRYFDSELVDLQNVTKIRAEAG